MVWFEPASLRGKYVLLSPLQAEDSVELSQAVEDGQLWKLWYTRVPSPMTMEGEIARRLRLQAEGTMLPFSVWDANRRAVGMTTYLDVDSENSRVEIGATWYRKSAQRTPINTECKFLLLRHAFETMKCVAVEFRTSSFNLPSRKAIERLGAKLDGILRCHAHHSDGSLRDTYVYSILATEWLSVRSHLAYQIECERN